MRRSVPFADAIAWRTARLNWNPIEHMVIAP